MNQQWSAGDRVKISRSHYGTGLQDRPGTVLRTTPGGYVEVEMDSMDRAGIGLVAFKPEDLLASRSVGRVRTTLSVASSRSDRA